MLGLLLGSAVAAGCADRANCLACLEVDECGFCWDSGRFGCVNVTQEKGECQNLDTTRSKRCVEELGGDAKNSVRYAVGFTILGAAIVIDLTLRFYMTRKARDDYSHL